MRSRTSGGCPKSSAALGRVKRSVNRFLGFHVVVHFALPLSSAFRQSQCVWCNVDIVAMILPGRHNVRRVLLHDRMRGHTEEPETDGRLSNKPHYIGTDIVFGDFSGLCWRCRWVRN
jgi:hypothetical protein